MPAQTPFSAWLSSRPDLQQALQSIHVNPAAALAAVPVTAPPIMYPPPLAGREVTPEEQAQVLNARRGKTLNRRIILKSYLNLGGGGAAAGAAAGAADGANIASTAAAAEAWADVRQARGLPIYTTGNVGVGALRGLLSQLGAGPYGRWVCGCGGPAAWGGSA